MQFLLYVRIVKGRLQQNEFPMNVVVFQALRNFSTRKSISVNGSFEARQFPAKKRIVGEFPLQPEQ